MKGRRSKEIQCINGVWSKQCNKCGTLKPVTDFYDNHYNKDGKDGQCKSCIRARISNYAHAHKELILARCSVRAKRHAIKIKVTVIGHYSSGKMACAQCGFDDIRALSVDHINGGGRKHRKQLKLAGKPFYQWLKSEGFPLGFQVLCMNCQFIKRYTNMEFAKRTVEKPFVLDNQEEINATLIY